MEARLEQAARLRRAGHFEEGLKVLEQARQRLGVDGPTDLREQVDRASADTALARRLDEARQRASAIAEGRKMDYAGAEQEYAAALQGAGLGREGEDAEAVAARVRASAVRAEVVAALDDWVGITRDQARREWLLAVARAADPDPLRDRLRQPERWRDKTSLAQLAQEASAQDLSPQLAAALARALYRSGGDAAALLRAAQAKHPDDFWLNYELGSALFGVKEWDEAIGFYRAALALRPRVALAHNGLGAAVHNKDNLDEAMRHYQRAIALDPKNATAHNNLGIVLGRKGKLNEAVRHHEEALRLDPNYAAAHDGLGRVLYAGLKVDEAIRHYERAIALDPKYAPAHADFGLALWTKLKPDEAIPHYEEALRLDPKFALAHYGLGHALLSLGRFTEARDAARRSRDLVPERDPLHKRATGLFGRCERLLALEARLPALLRGKQKPAGAAEAIEFAGLCQTTKRYAAAARFLADAFAADPKLADRPGSSRRYEAACYAALAAAGQGADDPKPDDKERARLRRQALGWLRAQLAQRQKEAESGRIIRPAAQMYVRIWQNDAKLAGVRDPQALALLSAEERAEWEKFWAEVADLRRRLDSAQSGAAPTGK
jgi:tetratricopeptide (TPR) repeat protein